MLTANETARILRALMRRVYAGCRAFAFELTAKQMGCASFSLYGEDMVLRAIFHRYPAAYRGFFVDVGAHHPERYSNTWYFYQRQWKGICVDPVPLGAELFAQRRPRDLYLPIGVAEREAIMTYYIFQEPAFNTFSESVANSYAFKWQRTASVPVRPLRSILADNLPSGTAIDFLSIDAEGLDLIIAKSSDWGRFRPKVVVTEAFESASLESAQSNDMVRFMAGEGYVLSGRSPSAFYFIDGKSPAYDGGPFLNYVKPSERA